MTLKSLFFDWLPFTSILQVKAMTDLVDAYQRNDINSFEKILKEEE